MLVDVEHKYYYFDGLLINRNYRLRLRKNAKQRKNFEKYWLIIRFERFKIQNYENFLKKENTNYCKKIKYVSNEESCKKPT